jgi:hypothetical protein
MASKPDPSCKLNPIELIFMSISVRKNSLRPMVFLAVLTALMLSCSHEDAEPRCGGQLEYNAGDSVVVCFSDSAVAFVGLRTEPNHYNIEAYLLREFKIARDANLTLAPSPYSLSFTFWKRESWDTRRAYLPYPYSHDLLGVSDAEFMYLIATYPEQCGFGWTDTYDSSLNLNDPTLGHIWVSDDPQTIQFDGTSENYEEYLSRLIYLQ